MRRNNKKELKEKVNWFIIHKNSMSRTRRTWALNGMEERYSDFIPYKNMAIMEKVSLSISTIKSEKEL